MKRFWKKVDKVNSLNGCWLWTASVSNHYGRFSIGKQTAYAHRFSYELANGAIPAGFYVCHTCDNPLCVNPAHLFLGTHQDNMDDRNNKGRMARGITNRAKLTESNVLDIRASAESVSDLAYNYGVSPQHIRLILSRKSWSHI